MLHIHHHFSFNQNRGLRSFFLALLGILFLSCAQNDLPVSELIRFNQVGFYPAENKTAVVASEAVAGETFHIKETASGKTVFSGILSAPRKSSFSDKSTCVLSFSSVTTPGEYFIEIPSFGRSHPFSIKESAWQDLTAAALKGFYYQRTALPIEETYAGKWNRPAAHPDDKVMIHPSAVSPGRPEGTLISSPKGWYDAGDYNKYIVNSGFTVGVLLALYEDYPEYVKKLSSGIPESGNAVPDLLDEVYWNLAWMLTMQDPADGGVYHKLTTPSFEGFIKPVDCRKQRYVVAKSVTAALDFAAVMAQASRLYASYEKEYPGLSDTMLQAARRAFTWATRHPESLYRQKEMNERFKPAVTTGEYGDREASDEFFWASAELYIATGDPQYETYFQKYKPARYMLPTWGNVSSLGALALIRHTGRLKEKGKTLAEEMRTALLAYADSTRQGYEASPFHAPYGRTEKDFFWGCNSDAASNQGLTFLQAWRLTRQKDYLDAALHTMDYILGRNATGYCYVTGFGTRSTRYPHHRLSASDGIDDPIPGLLAGGPNPGRQDGCEYPSSIPDEAYADVEGAYACNEIAINWQALFTYFAAGLDADLH